MSELRRILKNETAEAHARLDAVFSDFRLADKADYSDFLNIHAQIVPGVEATLEERQVMNLVPDWGDRRRTDALQADIRALGLQQPWPRHVPFPDDIAAAIGVAYVLEGSRIGARFLCRQVPAPGRGASAFPTAFLDHGSGKKLWHSFIANLSGQYFDELQTRRAVDAALAVFEAYTIAAREKRFKRMSA